MGVDIKIICDYCDKDLVYTSNQVDYRIVLLQELKSHKPGIQCLTHLHIYPKLERIYIFCDKKCLKEFINNRELK